MPRGKTRSRSRSRDSVERPNLAPPVVDGQPVEFNYAMVGQEANSWLATLGTLPDDELEVRLVGFMDHALSRGAGKVGTSRVIESMIRAEMKRRATAG